MTRAKPPLDIPELNGDEAIEIFWARPSRNYVLVTLTMPNGSAHLVEIRANDRGDPVLTGPIRAGDAQKSDLPRRKAALHLIAEPPDPAI